MGILDCCFFFFCCNIVRVKTKSNEIVLRSMGAKNNNVARDNGNKEKK
jgi:hypothetical protein